MSTESEPETLPTADIEACLADPALQRENSIARLPESERAALAKRRDQALARGAPDTVEWVYFTSPEWTWQHLCGRAGHLLYDRGTATQYEFICTIMN